jgi:hypothetical protein
MRISITVDGELVRQGLEDIQAEIPKIGRRRLRTIANRVVRIEQAYPPERPNQTYVRTGNFFSHWEIKEITEGKKSIGYMIENRARNKRGREYGRFVVGDAYGASQAWMHRGRWSLLRDVIDEQVKKLPPQIADDIVMVARREGFEAKRT